ncbi:MAG: DUF115 domain-containing protein [Candidatus Micrarchaeota archaeon]|nr:DUF115 domain-containing protein [Candidatus Micrarchaeota archaeon]
MSEWLDRLYPAITRKLSIDTSLDLEATELLDKLTSGLKTSEQELRALIEGKTCLVYGAGPSLSDTPLKVLGDRSLVHVAADGAARFFIENGMTPDVLVTDLDGGNDVIQACARNSIIVVHAHGDNMVQIRELIPSLLESKAKLILTTQTIPIGKVRNFFGFTDGDRAAWLCHEFGASEIILVGMDFGPEIGKYSKPYGTKVDLKRKELKLDIARQMIDRLASERSISASPWFSAGNDSFLDNQEVKKEFMEAAILQARKGMAEGGIPIGAVLVKGDRIISRGYNKRIQTGNRMMHAEMDCLGNALKNRGRSEVGGSTIYTTLMPCHMCAGAIIHYGIAKVVAADSKTFPNAKELLEREGISVADLDLEECRLMLEDYIENHEEYWSRISDDVVSSTQNKNQLRLGELYE